MTNRMKPVCVDDSSTRRCSKLKVHTSILASKASPVHSFRITCCNRVNVPVACSLPPCRVWLRAFRDIRTRRQPDTGLQPGTSNLFGFREGNPLVPRASPVLNIVVEFTKAIPPTRDNACSSALRKRNSGRRCGVTCLRRLRGGNSRSLFNRESRERRKVDRFGKGRRKGRHCSRAERR